MENMTRTHRSEELTKELSGSEVIVQGWVHKRRNFGGLNFIDIRDRSGIIQVVFEPNECGEELMGKAGSLRNEYVVSVRGIVKERGEQWVNPKLKTGEIEIRAVELEIISESKPLPVQIEDDVNAEEEVRFKYRYLDLRRPEMQRNIIARAKAVSYLRRFLEENGFIEVETPLLAKSTPEGAREYLVPSRINEGEFYALPQSPQLFKQLLMVAGLERYFQVAKCFRDESLRADRQPEFTQLDIEQSFIPLPKFQEMMEGMLTGLFKNVLDVEIPKPFPRITYREAMERYGSDKPDIRFSMELKDVSDIVKETEFKAFTSTLENGGQVKCICVPDASEFSRKKIEELEAFVKRYGAKGLAWMAYREEGVRSPIAKFFSEEKIETIKTRAGAKTGDLLLFVADNKKVVADALGSLRLHLAEELSMIDEKAFSFVWVTEFPLLEYDEEEERYAAAHHPFTSPMEEDLHLLETDPTKVRAKAYDIALNGFEIGGGSMRIYQKELQERMFKALGFTKEEAHRQFGFLMEAFEYGTPPHGGIAFGIDRLLMIMLGENSIKDVIAFPKTNTGKDLMTNAPSSVSKKQLDELNIELK